MCFFGSSLFSMGLGDWRCETGNGTTINHPGGGTNMWYKKKDKTYHRLQNLQKWYFYKNNVIGYYAKFDHDTQSWKRDYYFVLNEDLGTLDTFNLEYDWGSFLNKNQLVPPNKTKWYRNSWKPIDQVLLMWILCGFPFGLFFGIPYLFIGLMYSFSKGKKGFFAFLELTGILLLGIVCLFAITAIPALIKGYLCFSY